VDKLHALLRYLPVVRASSALSTSLPHITTASSELTSSTTLFHVDDTFNLRAKFPSISIDDSGSNKTLIVSGYLSQGKISIGDHLLLGPFSWTATAEEDDQHRRSISTQPNDPFLSPRSFGEALQRTTAMSRARPPEEEWVQVRVVSIRNLRLPVRDLHTDQAGTIGIIPSSSTALQDLVIRKGMVLAGSDGHPEASHAFTAAFGIAEASSVFVGSIVIVYSATVRAAAKVVAVQLQDSGSTSDRKHDESGSASDDDGFGFNLDEEVVRPLDPTRDGQSVEHATGILVTFQLLSCREWIGVGAKVLVMPGGSVGQGLVGLGSSSRRQERGKSGVAGLDGYVGRVVERFG